MGALPELEAMTFMATPADVLSVVRTARKLDANPFSLAGKLVGLGADEQRAGIPPWAWIVAGVGVGIAIGWRIAPAARERLKAFS
jgi:hypothetical protein